MQKININGEVVHARPVKKHHLVWLAVIAGAALLGIVFWLLLSQPRVVQGAEGQPLDCVSCHKIELNFHDKLGTGDRACYVCHDSTDATMQNHRLVNDEIIKRSDSSQLCGQCHQARYNAWLEGTHGIPGTVAAVSCVTCHNPHQPQIAFQNITKPPTPQVHSAPPLPTDWMMIIGITVIVLIIAGIIYARRGETA
ncbi:MAG: cytochrome c3 family protein [Dehalococcoidia bacterium]|nr:cytochrome c3 family protein [Dehalococcoidia bacterium]